VKGKNYYHPVFPLLNKEESKFLGYNKYMSIFRGSRKSGVEHTPGKDLSGENISEVVSDLDDKIPEAMLDPTDGPHILESGEPIKIKPEGPHQIESIAGVASFDDFKENLFTEITEYILENPDILDDIDPTGELIDADINDNSLHLLETKIRQELDSQAKDFYSDKDKMFFGWDISELIEEAKISDSTYAKNDRILKNLKSPNRNINKKYLIAKAIRDFIRDKEGIEPIDYNKQPEAIIYKEGYPVGYYNSAVPELPAKKKRPSSVRREERSPQVENDSSEQNSFEDFVLEEKPNPEESFFSPENIVEHCRTFSDLYGFLENQQVIRGSEEEFPASRVKGLIEDVRQGKRDSSAVTRTYGLRAKVAEFLGESSRFSQVRQVKSFDQLNHLIDRFGLVVGSRELFSPNKLKKIIEQVREGNLGLEYVTRTYGLRAKVEELLSEEIEEDIPDIVLVDPDSAEETAREMPERLRDPEEINQETQRKEGVGELAATALVESFDSSRQSEEPAKRWSRVKQYLSLAKLGLGRVSERWFGKNETDSEPERPVELDVVDRQAEKIKQEMEELKDELYWMNGKKLANEEVLQEYLYHQQKLFESKLSKAGQVQDEVVDKAKKYLERYLENSPHHTKSGSRAAIEKFEQELRQKLDKHNKNLLQRDVRALSEVGQVVLGRSEVGTAEQVVRQILEEEK